MKTSLLLVILVLTTCSGVMAADPARTYISRKIDRIQICGNQLNVHFVDQTNQGWWPIADVTQPQGAAILAMVLKARELNYLFCASWFGIIADDTSLPTRFPDEVNMRGANY